MQVVSPIREPTLGRGALSIPQREAFIRQRTAQCFRLAGAHRKCQHAAASLGAVPELKVTNIDRADG